MNAQSYFGTWHWLRFHPDGTVAKTNKVPSTNWFNRWRHIIIQSTSTNQL